MTQHFENLPEAEGFPHIADLTGVQLDAMMRSDQQYWWATLWMGLRVEGDCHVYKYEDVRAWVREYLKTRSWCVSMKPCDYVYSDGGGESGVEIGMLQYLLHKKEYQELQQKMILLARDLLVQFRQVHITVVTCDGIYLLTNNARKQQVAIGKMEKEGRQ